MEKSLIDLTKELQTNFLNRRKKRKRANHFLLQESKKIDYRLLLVTGIRISELLPLQIKQVRALFVESLIAIDRVKRGSSNHKAF